MEALLKGQHRSRLRTLTLWARDANRRATRFHEAAGWFAARAIKVDDRPGAALREVRYRLDLLPGFSCKLADFFPD